MSLFDLLQLRYEWEELARGFRGVGSNGTLDNLQGFLNTGHKSNRFRDGYEQAKILAETIINNSGCVNETSNLSSVSGEEI